MAEKEKIQESILAKLDAMEKVWLESLIADKTHYKSMYKDHIEKKPLMNFILEWIMPLMIIMLIPMLGFVLYTTTTATDYDRAEFMYKCVFQDETPQDRCEQILEGNYEIK